MNATTLNTSNNIFTRNNLARDTRYRYEVAQPPHKDSIVELFTRAFCESEPMTQYIHIDPKLFRAFSTQVTENAIRDQLSIVALDKNKVIACALVEDFAVMHEVPIDFDPNFRYIVSLLESLGTFFKDKKIEKNTIAHLFITAVDQAYRRQGLSTQVNFHAMELAAQRGFTLMYSELTNIFNEMGVFNHMKKNRRRLIGACDYKDFELDGFKPFPTLKGYAHGYLWELCEEAILRYTVDDTIIEEIL